jgi:hypothetical protein
MRHQSGSARSLPIVCASVARAVTNWAEKSSVSSSSAVAMAVAASRNLAVRPSRTSEAGTSGDASSPAWRLSSSGTRVMTSRMPRAPASRVSAVVVGLPLPFSRLAM